MNSEKMSKRNTRLLTWFGIFSALKPHAVVAIIYFEQITGSFALGMGAFSISAITASLAEVPTGILSDKIGRKNTIVLGSLFLVAGLVFYALADSFAFLAIGSILEGVAGALFSGNNDALIYESIDVEKRETRYPDFLGKIGAYAQVAAAIAALSGGFIADISFRYAIWASVVFAILALFITLFIMEPRVRSSKISTNILGDLSKAMRQFFHNAKLRTVSVAYILEWGVAGSMNSFRSAFIALLWPVWAIGIAQVLQNVASAFSSWFSGKIISKFGSEKVLLYGATIKSALGFISYGFPTFGSPVLLAVRSSFSPPIQISQNHLMQREFTDEQRATMSSLTAFVGNLAFGIFGFALGFFADMFGPAKTLLFGEVILLFVIYLYFSLLKSTPSIPKI